jgi:HEAT repeat protein
MPLVRKSPSGTQPTSAPSLGSADPDERWEAARALALDPDGAPKLAQALAREGEARVRDAIFTSLARLGTVECVDIVLPCLRSDDAALRSGAIEALKAMPATLAERLPSLLVDPDTDVRLLSCELVRSLPDDRANGLLTGILEHDEDENVCAAAVEVLAETGGREVLTALRRCAARFADKPFLQFSIKVAIDRIDGATEGAGEPPAPRE